MKNIIKAVVASMGALVIGLFGFGGMGTATAKAEHNANLDLSNYTETKITTITLLKDLSDGGYYRLYNEFFKPFTDETGCDDTTICNLKDDATVQVAAGLSEYDFFMFGSIDITNYNFYDGYCDFQLNFSDFSGNEDLLSSYAIQDTENFYKLTMPEQSDSTSGTSSENSSKTDKPKSDTFQKIGMISGGAMIVCVICGAVFLFTKTKK